VIQALRTPDERFADLPGYLFNSNYIDDLAGYVGLRMHYLDEGPRDAKQVFLCLHGEPTWSYLYRKMLPVFKDAGHRVVVPDMFGFGRSDKPADENIYTFDFHRRTLMLLIERLDLTGITLACQDWGGLLGLTMPMDMPGRFSRLLLMNTMLGTGDFPLSEGFLAWRAWVSRNPDMAVSKLMARTCPHLSKEECAAYDAPFPDSLYKGGVRRFPNLVPDRPGAPGAELSCRARHWLKTEWSGGTFMAIGMKDPVLGPPVMQNLRKVIRGCPKPYEVEQAGHFVPEWGDDIARKALETFK
jgi:haloalkane dehalogenase